MLINCTEVAGRLRLNAKHRMLENSDCGRGEQFEHCYCLWRNSKTHLGCDWKEVPKFRLVCTLVVPQHVIFRFVLGALTVGVFVLCSFPHGIPHSGSGRGSDARMINLRGRQRRRGGRSAAVRETGTSRCAAAWRGDTISVPLSLDHVRYCSLLHSSGRCGTCCVRTWLRIQTSFGPRMSQFRWEISDRHWKMQTNVTWLTDRSAFS